MFLEVFKLLEIRALLFKGKKPKVNKAADEKGK